MTRPIGKPPSVKRVREIVALLGSVPKPPASEQRLFDPKLCDHGAELNGAREWSWCENCEAEAYLATERGRRFRL